MLRENFVKFGDLLGHFDLSGQIRGIEAVRHFAANDLERLCDHKDVRLRSYQTLGLCAGSALIILLL